MLAAGVSCTFVPQGLAKRPWTPETSVAVRYFGEAPFSSPGKVHVSPDGRNFFAVAWHGDPIVDRNHYDLWIFAAADVAQGLRTGIVPAPRHRIGFHSGSNDPGISQPRWIDKGNALAFLGANEMQPPQLYRFELACAALTRVTNAKLGVHAFDAAAGSVVYFARTARKGDSHQALYPARLDPPHAPYLNNETSYADTWATFASFRGAPPRQVGVAADRQSGEYVRYWLSPDGAWAVMLGPLFGDRAPAQWNDYDVCAKSGRCSQFALIDLERGRSRSLLNAPTGAAVGSNADPAAIWAPDSQRVMLVDTALPLDRDITVRRSTAYIVEYDLQAQSFEVIAAMTGPHREIGRPRLTDGYSVSISESLNEPPQLRVASADDEFAVLPPDPALTRVAISRIQEMKWKDGRGNQWIGGLSLPSSREDGGRPALVIQAYVYQPQYFRPDGPASTAYAAQPLNGRGFAVLQMPLASESSSTVSTPEERPSFIAGLDAAIEELSGEGLIDDARVGLVGWSRGGLHAKYAATHPGKFILRAVIAADSWGASYNQYLSSAWDANQAITLQFENLYGGPFWKNQESWLAEEPSFSADRAGSALLLTANTYAALLEDLHLYGAFRLNGKPVETLYFPYGEHQLIRPAERGVSLRATVDWMAFWLQSYEDPDQAKAEQYARWRRLRD